MAEVLVAAAVIEAGVLAALMQAVHTEAEVAAGQVLVVVVLLAVKPAELVVAAQFVLFGPDVPVLSHQLARGRHELVYSN